MTNRLFSNLTTEGETLKRRSGSLVGCTALVVGTTVGAGILALPAVTLPSGVVPSTTALVAVWLYMVVSGLLVAEVNLNALRQLGRPRLGLFAMAECTLGLLGARAVGLLYAFIHYTLMVAYVTRGGEILAAALGQVDIIPAPLPQWMGAVLFATLFGGLLYFGSDRTVGRINSAFVGIVAIAFGSLLLLTATEVQPARWLVGNWGAVGAALPAMLVALVYQNVVPVIATELEGDVRKIRRAIVVGSAIPLVMFAIWNAVILGSINLDSFTELADGLPLDPLAWLSQRSAGRWLGLSVAVFSEFAIATSFIGFACGLLNFLGDIFNKRLGGDLQRLPLYALVLLPPLGLSTLNPNLFFVAIDVAGIFGTAVLFGIVPAVMSWQQRYRSVFPAASWQLVPGGRAMLVATIGLAVAVILQQVLAKTVWA
jgi:tyrosine-specific transport protein